MRGIHIIAVSVLILVSFDLTAADAEADPREQLETAFNEGIRLLEARDYATFLKTFVAPDELRSITERTSFDEFANQFGERNAPRLVQVLKSLKGVNPVLEQNAMQATYSLKEQIDRKETITWVKVGGRWYIRNRPTALNALDESVVRGVFNARQNEGGRPFQLQQIRIYPGRFSEAPFPEALVIFDDTNQPHSVSSTELWLLRNSGGWIVVRKLAEADHIDCRLVDVNSDRRQEVWVESSTNHQDNGIHLVDFC